MVVRRKITWHRVLFSAAPSHDRRLRMRSAGMILVGVSLALGGGSVAGQTTTFLRDAPISFMNKEDTTLLVRNYQQALDSLPDGHTNAWANSKTGHSGTATPLKTMKEGGTTCRLIEITNNAGGQSGRSEWKFCKTKEGWRSSGR
jgi:surface antigen